MADRLLVPYKTPLQRIIETVLVLAIAFAAAALWQDFLPRTSPSYVIVASLLIGFAVLPRLGALWAERHGAPMMSREDRTRRYLGEIGPMAPGPYAMARQPASARRRSRTRPH